MNPPEIYFSHKIVSITLATAIIAISCVLPVPLFPDRRKANWVSAIWENILYLIADAFLIRELCKLEIWKEVPTAIKVFCLRYSKKKREAVDPQQNEAVRLLNRHIGEHGVEPANYLARVFFVGYLSFHGWRIVNEFYFMTCLWECFNPFVFVSDFCKLILAICILTSVAFKPMITLRGPSSYFTWAIAGATCFSAAYSYVVEEVVYAYIEIVEKSIKDPHYGLDIPSNITKVEDYVAEIFRKRAICLEESLLYDHYILMFLLEMIPFSTELFAFATFFCFLLWGTLKPEEKSNPEINSEPDISSSTSEFRQAPEVAVILSGDIPPRDPSRLNLLWLFHRIQFTLLILNTAAWTWAIFYALADREDTLAMWLFNGQRIILQTLAGIMQRYMYSRRMKALKPLPSPPSKFQLDVILLILPLIPLGAIFTLRACPGMMNLTPVYIPSFLPREFQTLWNISLAAVSWFLFAYQVLFIVRAYQRLEHAEMSGLKGCFRWLVAINFCIWISWAMECKSISLHSGSSRMFGMVNWPVLVYATVPLALFGSAHSATCFWEIVHHLEVAEKRRDQ